ncbi:MAG: hypothetical protein ACK5YR_21845 [Pirellula sp.]|jgi:hypothetical protein
MKTVTRAVSALAATLSIKVFAEEVPVTIKNYIRLGFVWLTLCILIGTGSATSSVSTRPEYPKLDFIRDSQKETEARHDDFWENFEIYGRFVLASEVARAFEFPADSIPVVTDSIMFVGYYVIPEKPPFGYFEFHFDMEVEGVSFDLGGVSFAGMTYSPKRLPFCKLIRPPSGWGRPVPLKELIILLNKTPKLKLTSGFTK